MKMIALIRLMMKHLRLLIIAPLLLAVLVILLTREPKLSYTSSTVLYTGLASGSSIEMEKSFNYFATNTAFDNLINIIKSRETQEEVAIRLLSQHLLLPKADPKYISPKLYAAFKTKIPGYLYSYVVRSNTAAKPLITDSAGTEIETSDTSNLFPAAINRDDYEKTVASLTALMKSNDTNFIYKLLNYEDEHYSIKAISGIKPERLSNSDLIKISYEVNDPGICQQTLAIFNEVCIKNYKNIRENRGDAVVKYFEAQLAKASAKLKNAEDQLLAFNRSNNIINYYEQSKAVAVVKEDMEVDYNNKKAQLAGTEAAIDKLEEKLNIQQLVQLKSNSVLEKRKLLGDINFEIVAAEAEAHTGDEKKIATLKSESEKLKKEIRKSVEELYGYQNSVEGLPISTTLNEWINQVTEAENLKAKLKVMDQRNRDFQQQYAVYAPAGANIKRIEREISVSEQGYLEILHGLNLARLKLQDNTLTSNLKTVDPPFFPLQSVPAKRGLLVVASAVIGFILVLAVILTMEYFDDTLRNITKASNILQLPSLGMIPKILLKPGVVNFSFIRSRLLDISTQNMEQVLNKYSASSVPQTVLFISTGTMEGKTVIAGNICRKLTQEGKKVLFLTYENKQQPIKKQRKFPVLNRLLGYPDPRVDVNSPFLSEPATYLQPAQYRLYTLNEKLYEAKNYKEILALNNIELDFVPDYVFIELPALIYNNYPSALVSAASMLVLICRANRLWAEADQAALNNLQSLAKDKIHCIVNGVELKEVESVLGDLPKGTGMLRKKIKNLFRFQFFSKNQI